MNDVEMRGPRPKPKPVSNDKPEDAIVIPIIPTARGDDQSMDEIQQEIAATPNTPYQNALHDNYALKYYQKPAEPQNFVYYFYAKEGLTLILIHNSNDTISILLLFRTRIVRPFN